MADFEIDDTVDITDVVCPTTFVKAKVALEELDDGQILAIRMNDGEPVQNVPRSIKEEGHQILKLTANEDGTYVLIVRKVRRRGRIKLCGYISARKEVTMAVRANAENFEELVLKSELPVLVDFYSDSCIPCKMMAGIVGDIEDDYEGKLNVYKVNVNFDDALASEYEVLSAPTFIAFDKGEEIGRLTGKTTLDALLKLFEGKIN